MEDLLTTSNDLNISSGDFEIGQSNDQTVEHILLCAPGDLLEFPLLGVQIRKYLNSPMDPLKIQSEIRKNLIADRYNVKTLKVTRGPFEVVLDAVRS